MTYKRILVKTDLHKRVKLAATLQGITILEYAEQALKDKLAENHVEGILERNMTLTAEIPRRM